MTDLRERCKMINEQLQRDAILRQGNPIDTLFEFVLAERGRYFEPKFEEALPVTLYFPNETEREGFMEALRDIKPGMIVRKAPRGIEAMTPEDRASIEKE